MLKCSYRIPRQREHSERTRYRCCVRSARTHVHTLHYEIAQIYATAAYPRSHASPRCVTILRHERLARAYYGTRAEGETRKRSSRRCIVTAVQGHDGTSPALLPPEPRRGGSRAIYVGGLAVTVQNPESSRSGTYVHAPIRGTKRIAR